MVFKENALYAVPLNLNLHKKNEFDLVLKEKNDKSEHCVLVFMFFPRYIGFNKKRVAWRPNGEKKG